MEKQFLECFFFKIFKYFDQNGVFMCLSPQTANETVHTSLTTSKQVGDHPRFENGWFFLVAQKAQGPPEKDILYPKQRMNF